MNSIKVCEYSRSRSFHDDLILQDQASGERSQDQWSSGLVFVCTLWFVIGGADTTLNVIYKFLQNALNYWIRDEKEWS